MSDDEEVMHSEEEEEEQEAPPKRAPPQDSGPSEAERAMQRRRVQKDHGALDEEAQELLAENAELRAKMEEEINEMRQRSEQRKKEREEEERQLAIRRQEEEARRKKEEEERTAKKKAEEAAKIAARAEKMAEFEKWKNTSKPNFVISKKAEEKTEGGDEDEDEEGLTEKKSKEQLEAEKRAILDQRTPKLEIAGFDSAKLSDKAKELHNLIMRLESEKYDLEKRFKAQQYDMMELAERARSMNKVGRGGLKRVQLAEDEVDKMSEMFAGCPSKIVMYSQFERQKDPRNWGQRQTVFTGPHFLYPAAKIDPTRIVKFNPDTGLPEYEDIPGAQRADDAPAEAEEEE